MRRGLATRPLPRHAEWRSWLHPELHSWQSPHLVHAALRSARWSSACVSSHHDPTHTWEKKLKISHYHWQTIDIPTEIISHTELYTKKWERDMGTKCKWSQNLQLSGVQAFINLSIISILSHALENATPLVHHWQHIHWIDVEQDTILGYTSQN